MIQRHVLENGKVRYCVIDELPPEVGGGFQAVITSKSKVRGTRNFQTLQKAERWVAKQIGEHECGTLCHKAEAESVALGTPS